MILPSNGCPLSQPNNQANSYFIDWESEISLKGKWEVALTEFSFNNFYEVRDKCTILYSRYVRDSATFTFSNRGGTLQINNKLLSFSEWNIQIWVASGRLIIECIDFPYDLVFDTLEDALVMGYTKKVQTIKNGRTQSPLQIQFDTLIVSGLEIIFNRLVNRFTVKEFKEYKLFPSPKQVEAYIRHSCNEIFNRFIINVNGYAELSLKEDINSIVLDKTISHYFGFGNEELKLSNLNGKIHMSPNKAVLSKPFHQVFIYSNIVEPVHVGGVRVPLLRLVWVENKYGEGALIHENIDRPMYLPVCGNSINNIEVELRDDSGRLINFPKGSITTLSVHFHKNE